MARFQKKPMQVDAIRNGGPGFAEAVRESGIPGLLSGPGPDGEVFITEDRGEQDKTHTIELGVWLVNQVGTKRVWACTHEHFEETYEPEMQRSSKLQM